MRRSMVIVVAAAAILGFSSCHDEPLGGGDDCLCTTEFVQIFITVLDSDGRPAPDISLDISMVRTGEVLDASLLGRDPTTGGYAIFNDSFIRLVHPLLRNTGEELRVVGCREDVVFDETFVVGVPGECPCHVRKLAGPDTIEARSADAAMLCWR